MTKNAKQSLPSKQSQEEAYKIALGIQRPGQTKEQTKLIAQGITKGIDLYKKQQKSRAREQDKLRKKSLKERELGTNTNSEEDDPGIIYRQHWLPWALLLLTWVGLASYFLLK